MLLRGVKVPDPEMGVRGHRRVTCPPAWGYSGGAEILPPAHTGSSGWKSVLVQRWWRRLIWGQSCSLPKAMWSTAEVPKSRSVPPPPQGDVSPASSHLPLGCHPKEPILFPPPMTPPPSAHGVLVILGGDHAHRWPPASHQPPHISPTSSGDSCVTHSLSKAL